VGGTVGGVVALLLGVLGIFIYSRRQRRAQQSTQVPIESGLKKELDGAAGAISELPGDGALDGKVAEIHGRAIHEAPDQSKPQELPTPKIPD
jgi:hypothetical protein